ncbi:MAG TPA: SRPBCC family protein [Ohtaekwangia sp.]|nr:SRPBCC family protein [Ohtaekwangia sp.]
MKNEPIVFERTYNAPVSKVWKALTDRNGMKHWYFDISAFEPVVGFEFRFVAGNEGREFVHLCKVVEVIPEKKLKHSWQYEGVEGSSFVTWELFSEGKNKTRVKLTHEGLDTFPQNKDFAKQNFIQGWTAIVGTLLANYVEVSYITKSIALNVSPEQVWQILVSLDAVANWAQAFSEGTIVESDFEKGSPIVWKTSGGEVGVRGVITERIENRKLVFAYFEDGDTSSSQPAPNAYKEDFEIALKDGKTILTVNAGPLSKTWVNTHDPLWDKAMEKIAESIPESGDLER